MISRALVHDASAITIAKSQNIAMINVGTGYDFGKKGLLRQLTSHEQHKLVSLSMMELALNV